MHSMQLGIERDPVEAQVEVFRRDARKERFSLVDATPLCGNGFGSSWSSKNREPALGEPVVGTSTAIFRPFLRLRTTPDPANVRPEKVLSASLSCLLKKHSQPPGGWEAVREQLWSIRQDLLVQHLHRGRVAAEVALEGARLSARAGDVAELHRSLATLVGSGHCAKRVQTWAPALRDEVSGLRLLYLTHGGLEGTPGRLEGELLEFFQEHFPATPSCASRPGRCLDFARRIHRTRVSGNCARHLRLASQGSETSNDSCDRLAWTLATSVRKRGLAALAKAFPEGVSTARAAAILGLQGEADLEAWLASEISQAASSDPISRGRLDAAAVAARFADQQRAAAAPREVVVSTVKHDTDEAPIWSELRPSATSQLEVLKKMAANASSSVVSKALKKAAKKEKKLQKKMQKKEKKKLKKTRKKEKKEAKKRKQSSSSSVSSIGEDAD
eukprot:TRINITY_DN15850_c1_g1_i1.p1 TRINITY_DN15850_c1_g1~~TRINITY_DN15850_c1_g1_i1.p1  ORF type:complete len:444 (-),score=82.42 TRINITY_DN15850_c1_g1_i1:90-1421(-)